MAEMIELKSKTMLDYLKRGLSMAYGLSDDIEEGTVKNLISEVLDGKTYEVDYAKDSRVNKGVPYIIVKMKESENWLDDWKYFVGKSVEI